MYPDSNLVNEALCESFNLLTVERINKMVAMGHKFNARLLIKISSSNKSSEEVDELIADNITDDTKTLLHLLDFGDRYDKCIINTISRMVENVHLDGRCLASIIKFNNPELLDKVLDIMGSRPKVKSARKAEYPMPSEDNINEC